MIRPKDLDEDAQQLTEAAGQYLAQYHIALGRAEHARHLKGFLPDEKALAALRRIVDYYLVQADEETLAALCAELGIKEKGKKRLPALRARLWGKDGD